MANRLFQGTVHQMASVIDRIIGVVDHSMSIIACSDLGRIGELDANLEKDSFSETDYFTVNGNTYKVFGEMTTNPYVLFVEGEDEQAKKYAGLLAVSFSGLREYYEEKYDSASFVKNVLLDNILPGDIYQKAKELNFDQNDHYAVLLVRIVKTGEIQAYDVLLNMFPDRSQDFVVGINDTDIAVVKHVQEGVDGQALEQLANSIIDTLSGESLTKAIVGLGTVITGLRGLANSFKEAQTALEVGKVFDTEKSIVNYEHLGIARLIYQLPTTMCEMFMNEVFKKDSLDDLDSETLFTIHKFFENNLNVSETSRKLFIHRNTLVYRLEKIKKITGLDLRDFEDAIVFKVALMVGKYLSSD